MEQNVFRCALPPVAEKQAVDKNTELQDALRTLLAITKKCLELKEKTDVLESVMYEDFWNDLDEIIMKSKEEAKNFIDLKEGDHIIITGGFNPVNNEDVSPTNFMKIEKI